MRPTDILRLFDEWEQRTRGVTTWPHRVPIEPACAPLFPKERMPKPVLDDARRPGLLDRLRSTIHEPASTGVAESAETHVTVIQREIVEFELLLPADFAVKPGVARSWLASLRSLTEPLSFEVLGLSDRVVVQLACGVMDSASVIGSLRSHFPEAKARERKDFLRQEWERDQGYGFILGFGLKERVFRKLRTEDKFDVDPLIGIIGGLNRLSEGELGLVQLLVAPAKEPWGEEFENFALSIEDADKVLPLIRSKFSEPLFATVLRVAAVAPEKDRASERARNLAYAVSGAMRSEANELVLADSGEHSFETEVEDLLDRAAHRSGMLLSTSEILKLLDLT